MLALQVRDILLDVAKKAYPEVEHQKFYLKIINEQRKSKHGDWTEPHDGKSAVIQVFNLTRGTHDIVKTSLHELGHNTEYSIYGSTGHSKRFYEIYKKLLETAIEMNVIKLDEINSTRDIDLIRKHHGEIVVTKQQQYKGNVKIIKVKNAFLIKDQLKQMGFGFNSIEKTWDIEIKNEDAASLQESLKLLTADDNIVITDFSDLSVDLQSYIVVGGETKGIKDNLKENGYYFHAENGICVWIKKVYNSQIEGEIEFLKQYENEKIKWATKNI